MEVDDLARSYTILWSLRRQKLEFLSVAIFQVLLLSESLFFEFIGFQRGFDLCLEGEEKRILLTTSANDKIEYLGYLSLLLNSTALLSPI
jgi:hypothetical protein